MAIAQIGRNSVGDIKLSAPGALIGVAVSYRAQFQFFSIRSIVPQIDSSTFADEPNTSYEPGEGVMIATMNGLLKKGTTGSAIALPMATNWLPAPQKVAGTFQYDTSCTVGNIGADGTASAGWWNFEDTLATRGVNTNSVIAGTARSCGVTNVAWVLT
jgi:hypothetical protein